MSSARLRVIAREARPKQSHYKETSTSSTASKMNQLRFVTTFHRFRLENRNSSMLFKPDHGTVVTFLRLHLAVDDGLRLQLAIDDTTLRHGGGE